MVHVRLGENCGQHDTNEHVVQFRINIPEEEDQQLETVIALATLKLHLRQLSASQKATSGNVSAQEITVTVYQHNEVNLYDQNVTLQRNVITSRVIMSQDLIPRSHTHRWLEFDVTSAVELLLESGRRGTLRLSVDVDGEVEDYPFIIGKTTCDRDGRHLQHARHHPILNVLTTAR
jgi:hypothetical protein